MKAVNPCAIACLMLIAQAAHALAAKSDWAQTEGASMRIVLATPIAGQPQRGILEVVLDAGWKTYWREPGDGGIPPSLTAGPSQMPVALAFPAPDHITLNGLAFAGYSGAVIFPFVLPVELGQTPLALSAFVGVCSTVCVPFQADFELPANAAAAPSPSMDKRVRARLMRCRKPLTPKTG
ncbi:MAG: hypothetical protein HC779_02615 [Phyllobacteriaceae bacterium]|nr:hypothetical protein [Phyllobacteriaceae bacterium]